MFRYHDPLYVDKSWWSAVAWLMIVQTVFNLYPILHLRWARIRLGRLHERTLSHHA